MKTSDEKRRMLVRAWFKKAGRVLLAVLATLIGAWLFFAFFAGVFGLVGALV